MKKCSVLVVAGVLWASAGVLSAAAGVVRDVKAEVRFDANLGDLVRLTATHAHGKDELKPKLRAYRFVVTNSDGRTVERWPDSIGPGVAEVTFDLADFAPGENTAAFVVRKTSAPWRFAIKSAVSGNSAAAKDEVAARHLRVARQAASESLVLLENDEDPLECGIDIIARPPGKRPQSVTLLSGGERTMTAVALLFAIFRIKPAPFTMLDELDAALDDANIGRFVEALKEFLDRSQFLIITHNQHTIAGSDLVYGVSQQEKGVSRVISMKLSDLGVKAKK